MSENLGNELPESCDTTSLANFLKARKYGGIVTDLVDCSVMDILVKQAIESESGQNNVLTFSAATKEISGYFKLLEEQFVALKTYIAGTSPAYKQELVGLKFPLFVNIYLELVQKTRDKRSMLFYNQHVGDFLTEHKEELQHLRGITGPEKLSTSDVAANFRKSKFVHKLSYKVFMNLLHFLSTQNRSILLHFIDKNIHLDINNVRTSLLEMLTKRVSNETDKANNDRQLYNCDLPTELSDAMEALNKQPPNLPTVILHSVTNNAHG